jgi:TnpA family transposase
MAVDSETHFSWELLGRAPSAPEELIPLYSAVLVGAMGLDHTDVAMMIPGVRLSAIRRASHLIEQERGLRRANDGVVEFLLRQPLSNQWGQGYEASSDLMSLDVSRHLWTARVDPKRRRHAVGTYTHVLDRWGIVYDQPLLAATRQAGAAIEGAIRQTITRLARLAVDTHGYTDFAMIIAKLLGFDLCPRLYSMHDRHLHVPRGFDVPSALANLVRQNVSTAPIVAGQLQRTVYLCDYFTLPEFRRPLHHVLERGESVHALQRQICTQPLPSKRGRNADELIATSGALTLVTNCVMAWNTQRLQRAVERESGRTAPRFSIDALKHIGPVGHRHINFRGTYRFPIDRYAARLMQSAA